MTFVKFEELVKGKYPNARVFKHGEFVGNKETYDKAIKNKEDNNI